MVSVILVLVTFTFTSILCPKNRTGLGPTNFSKIPGGLSRK